MKRKQIIYFNPIDGSAPLAVYWTDGPFGVAHEAIEGNGVYYLNKEKELIGVQFDDIDELNDLQSLTTSDGIVITVSMKKGKPKISYSTPHINAA